MGNGYYTSTSTAGTWYYWVANTSNCTSTTTTIAGDPWDTWIDSNATSTGSTWVTWATTTTSGGSGRVIKQQRVIPYRQTPQEAAEARRREEEYRERQKVEAERYRAAKERAEGLLYEHLTDEQRAEIKRSKFFVVVGGKTGRRYKINSEGGLSGNVHEIDDSGGLKRRLCAHIEHAANAPIFDHLLAQKLMLEYQEEAFLKVANDHGR